MLADLKTVEDKLYKPEHLETFLKVVAIKFRNTPFMTLSNNSTKLLRRKQGIEYDTASQR